MNTINENRRQRTSKGATFGLIMIFIGLALIANQFDVIPYDWKDVLFTWQSLLIIIGIVFISSRDNRITGYILLGVGGFFLIPELVDVPWEYRRLFWPVIFILAGILIIFKGTGLIRSQRYLRSSESADYLDDVNVFGGGDRQITSRNFKGGSIVSVFGGGKYDFRQAGLGKESCVIEVVNVFGGSNLIVPSNWNVKSEVVGIFGGFSDKRHIIEPDASNTIIIKGVAIFGGGDIKNA